MSKAIGYAAQSAQSPLAPFSFQRRGPGPLDGATEFLYCGVFHPHLPPARNKWKTPPSPALPGHEIVGRVPAVGGQVKRFKKGDLAAVGCMVDSCRTCAA